MGIDKFVVRMFGLSLLRNVRYHLYCYYGNVSALFGCYCYGCYLHVEYGPVDSEPLLYVTDHSGVYERVARKYRNIVIPCQRPWIRNLGYESVGNIAVVIHGTIWHDDLTLVKAERTGGKANDGNGIVSLSGCRQGTRHIGSSSGLAYSALYHGIVVA